MEQHQQHHHLRMRMAQPKHVDPKKIERAKHKVIVWLVGLPSILFLLSQIPQVWRHPGDTAIFFVLATTMITIWYLKVEMKDRKRTLRSALHLPAGRPDGSPSFAVFCVELFVLGLLALAVIGFLIFLLGYAIGMVAFG